MRRIVTVECLLILVAAAFPAVSVAQRSPDYTLVQGSGFCFEGDTIAIPTGLEFGHRGVPGILGVAFGVCHEPALVTINCRGGIPNDCVDNGLIVPGHDVGATNDGSGPDFFAPSTTATPFVGYTVGIVISLTGADVLSNTGMAELTVATYECSYAPGPSPLTICETGDPLVPIRVAMASGAEAVPKTVDGEIFVAFPPPYTLVQGSGECTVGETIAIPTTLAFESSAPDVAGLAYGVCHDPKLVDIGCTGGVPNDCVDNGIIVQGADVAATNAGVGAAFFAPATSTNPLVGYNVGIVINLLGADNLPNTGTAELVVATYCCLSRGVAPLALCETGTPIVPLVISPDGGGDEMPVVVNGEIRVMEAVGFIRGDCNGDGRAADIADGIFILNHLFQGGPSSLCAEACDVNADGMFDGSDAFFVVAYRILDGPMPPQPFPQCGVVDAQVCPEFNGCP